MRRFLGYALIAIAGLVGALSLVFVLFAGGNEGDALRTVGFVYLTLAAAVGLAGLLILRSGRSRQ